MPAWCRIIIVPCRRSSLGRMFFRGGIGANSWNGCRPVWLEPGLLSRPVTARVREMDRVDMISTPINPDLLTAGLLVSADLPNGRAEQREDTQARAVAGISRQPISRGYSPALPSFPPPATSHAACGLPGLPRTSAKPILSKRKMLRSWANHRTETRKGKEADPQRAEIYGGSVLRRRSQKRRCIVYDIYKKCENRI